MENDPALVADWTFDKPADGAFVARGAQHLRAKIVDKVESADGPTGKVIRLDGSGYLEVADCPALKFSEACTLEALVRPQELPPSGARIIDKSEVGTSNGFLLDTHPGNSLRLITQAGTLSHDAKLPAGQWVHLAGTLAPDGQVVLYVQGKPVARQAAPTMSDVGSVLVTAERLRRFHQHLTENGLGGTYEAAHARLAINSLATAHTRLVLLAERKLKPLADPLSQTAADQSYLDTARKLADGLAQVLTGYEKATDQRKQEFGELWKQSASVSR